MRFIYPVELEEVREGPPEDHCVLATFPDLPEANTFGKDRADALTSAVDCLEVALAGRIKDRTDIPEPSPARGRPTVAPGNLIAAKAALYLAMQQEDVRPAELARRMAVDQPAARPAARQSARAVRRGVRRARQAPGAVARKRRLSGKRNRPQLLQQVATVELHSRIVIGHPLMVALFRAEEVEMRAWCLKNGRL